MRTFNRFQAEGGDKKIGHAMTRKIGSDTLLIIPCCAAKASGGQGLEDYSDPLAQAVSGQAYSAMLSARASVLRSVKLTPKFLIDKYKKNGSIHEGPDLGGESGSGRYTTALSRYVGTLYSVDGFKSSVEKMITSEHAPQIMILSALYGPLHPLSLIQDYNLMMSDAPARAWATAFPPFLEEYVQRNAITQIVLYVGTSTAYFKIAKKAVASLSSKGLITRAVQYHVENGSTRTTPLQHGLRLLDDLNGEGSLGSTRSTGIIENIL